VAGVRNEDTRQLVHQLSGELDKKHRLVAERGTTQIADQPLYLYHFRHNLFQQHIYNGLGEIERKMLHKDVGEVLEALYGDQTDEIASQLAMHFSQAGEVLKAIPYLLLAGNQARDLYSHQEAIIYYQQALGYLKQRGNYDLAARTLMKLGLTYHTAFEFQQSQVAYKEGFALWKRAAELKHTVLPPVSRALKVYFEMGIPTTIDPSRCRDSNSAYIIDQLFRGLVEITPENDIVPAIARTWEVMDEGRKYRFYLRDDVFWSDGVRVTAGDFEYGWKRALEQDSLATIASNFYDIKGARAFHRGVMTDANDLGVRALDEMTLEIELESPAGYFIYLLGYFIPSFPVPRHVVEKLGEEWTQMDRIVTNGPFVLGSWEPGKPMVLTRNPKYYGEYQGNVEKVELTIGEAQPDLSPIKLYENDKIDILTLSTNAFHSRHLFPGEYFSCPEMTTYSIIFNVQRAPFIDPRVRKAFVLATDRQYLANVVLGGLHLPATGGLVPPMIPGHSPGIALEYDPEEARHLLAQAGYPGGGGFPMVDFLVSRRREVAAQYLQDQWFDVLGVRIDLRFLAGSTYWEAKDNYNYHVVFGGWTADSPDPDNFLRVYMQNVNWVDEVYSRLLEEARQSNDQRQRIELYQQAERILIEQVPIMPVYYNLRHFLVKPWIRFRREHEFLYFKDVIQEPH
jgi:oligopeptide transport system substrate-binding protein